MTGPVISPGYVQVDPVNASRFMTSNGRRYFPLGHNVAWDTSTTTNVVSTLARLGAVLRPDEHAIRVETKEVKSRG